MEVRNIGEHPVDIRLLVVVIYLCGLPYEFEVLNRDSVFHHQVLDEFGSPADQFDVYKLAKGECS